MDLFWFGGEGPRDIPPAVNVYLHNSLQVAFEEIVGLRAVQKIGFWDGKPVTFVRIYDPLASNDASMIKDFTSLDQNPELILYEGYWDKDNNSVFMERKTARKPK